LILEKFFQNKNSSCPREPAGVRTGGTISIPKEVILLALSYAIYASSRRGLISADKTDFFPQTSRLIAAHFTLALPENASSSTRENALLTFYYIKLKYAISSVSTLDIALSRAKSN